MFVLKLYGYSTGHQCNHHFSHDKNSEEKDLGYVFVNELLCMVECIERLRHTINVDVESIMARSNGHNKYFKCCHVEFFDINYFNDTTIISEGL